MKRRSDAGAVRSALLAVVVLLVASGPRADAQSPAPATPDTIAFETDEPGNRGDASRSSSPSRSPSVPARSTDAAWRATGAGSAPSDYDFRT